MRTGSSGSSWLINHIIDDIEEVRKTCALGPSSGALKLLVANFPPPVLSTVAAPSDFSLATDLIIVDVAERLGQRDRIQHIQRRQLPLRSISLYVVTDSPNDAQVEIKAFEHRLKASVFCLNAKCVEVEPETPTMLAEAAKADYVGWVLQMQIDQSLREVEDAASSIGPSAEPAYAEMADYISAERAWINKRLLLLREDLKATLRAPNAVRHATSYLDAVERDLSERYGFRQTLIEPTAYIQEQVARGPGMRVLDLARDAVLTVKTFGLWLIPRIDAALKTNRDPQAEKLLSLFDRDLRIATDRVTSDLQQTLPSLASAKAAANNAEFAKLQRLRAAAGNLIALRRRLHGTMLA